MKKRSIFVLLLTTLTIGTAVPATAAPCGYGRGPHCGQNYVDADGDGVCDNYTYAGGNGFNGNGCGRNPYCGQNYVDADGDGICDNFVDNNGDGINDNCPGFGNGQGRRNGQGQYKATAASSAKRNTAKKTVVKKSTIKKVQKRLNKIGYKCGKANGVMNAKTKKALRRFKKAKKLKINSTIDTSTLKALRISR